MVSAECRADVLESDRRVNPYPGDLRVDIMSTSVYQTGTITYFPLSSPLYTSVYR
jgi:hypothetical protein